MKIVENEEPKKRKNNFNRNKKKNWRHKIKLEDIEDAFDEKRREETLKTMLSERPFDDLFVLDSNTKSVEPEKKVISLENQGSRSKTLGKSSRDLKKKNKQPLSQGLKCHELLSGLPGVKPVSKGGNKLKQRVPKILVSARKASKNTKKAKILRNTLKQNRAKDLAKKKLMHTSKVFTKDLWKSKEESRKLEQRYGKWGKSYLEHAVQYYKVNRGLSEIKRPVFRFVMPCKLPINNPHPGTSYNPSLKDHKNLIEQAMIEEQEEEAKILKQKKLKEENIQYAMKAPSESEVKAELLSGIPEELLGKPAVSKEPSDDEQNEVMFKARPKPRRKTKKDRLKTLKAILTRRLDKRNKARKLREDEFNNLDKLVKEIDKAELKAKRKIHAQRRKRQKEPFITKRLGPLEFKKDPLCLPTLRHLKGNVRSIEPIGAHIASNINNKQQRNVMAPEKLRKKFKRRVKAIPRSGNGQGLSDFVKEINIEL